MAGFSVILSKNSISENIGFRPKPVNPFYKNYIHKQINSNNFKAELFSPKKFEKDKVLFENTEFVVISEGIILNLQELLNEFQHNSVSSLLIHLYSELGESFIQKFKGDFSGLIYEKRSGKIFVYGNQTGSKRIFYYNDNNNLIVSSDLAEISHLMHEMQISKSLNITASYLLLTCGFMLEEHTLVNEVKRLMPGCYLTADKNFSISTKEFFHLRNISKTNDSVKQIIQNMDDLFAKAIKRQFEKDKDAGYNHTVTLSGGLDSRMVALFAHELGYTNQHNFTFSQENYLDEKIARKIAADYNHQFEFLSLGKGDYLKQIDEAVYLNDGLVLYSGAAHVLHAVKHIDLSNYGIIHTGLIGDAVIGSFLSAPEIVKPATLDGMYATRLAQKIEHELKSITGKYESEELYKFYSRAFLAAMNGNYTFDLVSHAVSPFLDVDFLSYCYSIPENLKYKQKIYLQWIAEKHRDFGLYAWEKTGVPPLKSDNFRKYLDHRFYQRMMLKLTDRLSSKMKSGMNPFDYWMADNEELRKYIMQYFVDNIEVLNDNNELKNDCILQFEQGNAGEKFQVLTLLSAIKLHQLY